MEHIVSIDHQIEFFIEYALCHTMDRPPSTSTEQLTFSNKRQKQFILFSVYWIEWPAGMFDFVEQLTIVNNNIFYQFFFLAFAIQYITLLYVLKSCIVVWLYD